MFPDLKICCTYQHYLGRRSLLLYTIVDVWNKNDGNNTTVGWILFLIVVTSRLMPGVVL